MTQWWRLLYDAGHKPVTRWVKGYEHDPESGLFWSEDHLDRSVVFSPGSTWLLQEIDELPPRKQRECGEAIADG